GKRAIDDGVMRSAATLRATPVPVASSVRSARPRRGSPEETRSRLVAAAAREFSRVGYDGTDSNRLARAAGYAPATFYKHFPDKRAIFLAAYQRWVDTEWASIEREIRRVEDPQARARRIVDATIAHHTRWRGLRASLRGLVTRDAAVRAFYRVQRRRQLEMLAGFGRARTPPA